MGKQLEDNLKKDGFITFLCLFLFLALPEVQTSSVADSPKPSNVTTIDSIRPSYFGYLSGVVSSLWKADQTKIQDGQTVVTSPPVKEK